MATALFRIALRPVDDFEVEYHLTPDGWKRGSEWFFGQIQAEYIPPPGRVLTLRKRLFQASPTVDRTVTWITVWRDPRMADIDLELLRSRFPLAEPQ